MSNMENEEAELLAGYKGLGLNPEVLIGGGLTADVSQRVRLLEQLMYYVMKYHELGSIEKMQEAGMQYPPVFPGLGPDEDWQKFKRWVKKMKTYFTIDEALVPADCREDWTDDDYKRELEKTIQFLDQLQVRVDFCEGTPAKACYEALAQQCKGEKFDILGPDTYLNLTLCSGRCDDCFQRDYCEMMDDFPAY